MTAALHLVTFDASADPLPEGDLTPRLVPPDAAALKIPRPTGNAATILAEWSPPGASYYTRTEHAADTDDTRNPAWWRAVLGAGSLRLTSHPIGTLDAAGYKTRRVLGVWSHEDEVPDAVRFDAAPKRARVTVAGMVVDAVLMACPDGVPHYGVADVCPLARLVREARRNNNSAATGRGGRE